MNKWLLQRFAFLPTGTLSQLFIPDGPTIFMIERPWLNNKAFVSCIPEGTYELEWDTTGRIKQVPRLRNTLPRTQINIHPANYPYELHGCLAPGLSWSINNQAPKVNDSRKAMALLLEMIDRDTNLVGERSDWDDGYGLGILLQVTSAGTSTSASTTEGIA